MSPPEEKKRESPAKKFVSLVLGAIVCGVICGGLLALAAAWFFSPGHGFDPLGMEAPSNESSAGQSFTIIFIVGVVAGVVGWVALWMESNSD